MPDSLWKTILWKDDAIIELFGHNSMDHLCRKDGKAYSPQNRIPIVTLGLGNIIVLSRFSS